MQERHESEQYFFTDETTGHLADFAARFPNPCCICAPSVGVELGRRGVRARVLDIDERFATTRGFRHYDLFRPEWLGEEFGIILCDPPFFNVSLSQLFAALRLLSRNRYEQPLLDKLPGPALCQHRRHVRPFRPDRDGLLPALQDRAGAGPQRDRVFRQPLAITARRARPGKLSTARRKFVNTAALGRACSGRCTSMSGLGAASLRAVLLGPAQALPSFAVGFNFHPLRRHPRIYGEGWAQLTASGPMMKRRVLPGLRSAWRSSGPASGLPSSVARWT